jgi:hypothetical protein
MRAERRHLSEQEHSIKEREHELFIRPVSPELEALGPAKPFSAYMRETPASPLSPLAKTTLWLLGIVVATLFFLSVWRVAHPHRARAQTPTAPAPAKAVMLRGVGRAGLPAEEAIRVIPFRRLVEVETLQPAPF